MSCCSIYVVMPISQGGFREGHRWTVAIQAAPARDTSATPATLV